MSRGHDRRQNDLENYEAAFALALEKAKAERVSAYIADKQGRQRGGATELDVELFTLESKIIRMRELLGMPPFVVALPKSEVAPKTEGWPSPPNFEATVFAMSLAAFYNELDQSGREPTALFAKVKYAGAKNRQGADQASWRLAAVEVGEHRTPAKLTLTLFPLPEHPDADVAAQKLADALQRLVRWSEKARETPARERPRLLNVTFTRSDGALGFHAR